MLMLCLIVQIGYSQTVKFYLYITDKDRIVEYEDGTPVFDDEDINDIIADYTITHFAKAFPQSEYGYMHMVYKVHCDSIGLAEELCTFDSTLFYDYAELPEPFLNAYFPND